MLPNFESFKNSQKFLIMSIIIQLYYSKNTKVKGNWINWIFLIYNWKNCSESIVRDISFYNKLSIGDPVHKNRSGVKSIITKEVELSENIFLDKIC